MKKMYQAQWHKIPFSSFTTVSSKKIAGADFYSDFYNRFFKSYKKLDDLDPLWVKLKMQVAAFLKQDVKFSKDAKILSIGCGLGFVEKGLFEEGFKKLEVTEVSKAPLQWLLPFIPGDHVHTGFFPGCLPPGSMYEYIYLAGVDTFFTQTEFIKFLKEINKHLLPIGRCMIISWSFMPARLVSRIVLNCKDLIKFILDKLGLSKRGQFWGYIRGPEEFQKALSASGFMNIREGHFEKKTPWDTYWVSADKSLRV